MSVYIDAHMKPLLREIKHLEQRLNKLEALVNGDISPAFPFTQSSIPSVDSETGEKNIGNTGTTDNRDLAEEYLKAIHENVLIIKDFIDEYRLTTADRHFLKLQS